MPYKKTRKKEGPTRADEVREEKKKFLEQITQDILKTQSFECVVERFARLGNPASGRQYRGMNVIWLNACIRRAGYKDPRFLTFKQGKDYGLHLRKGEKSTLVHYSGTVQKKLSDEEYEIEKPKLSDYELQNHCKLVYTLKEFYVFNGEQFEDMPPVRQEEYTDERREAIIADVKKNLQKDMTFRTTGEGQAYYNRAEDSITLPDPKIFRDSESEARTLFHELAHSTMTEERTGRVKLNLSRSEEECVAELASGLLYKELGFKDPAHDDYTRNYLVSWSSDPEGPMFTIQKHPEKLAKYINMAEQAADFIRDHWISKELRIEMEKFPPLEQKQEKAVTRGKLAQTENVAISEPDAAILRGMKVMTEAKEEKKERLAGKMIGEKGFSQEEVDLLTQFVPESQWEAAEKDFEKAAQQAEKTVESSIKKCRLVEERQDTAIYEAPKALLSKLQDIWRNNPEQAGKKPEEQISGYVPLSTTFRFECPKGADREAAFETLCGGKNNREGFRKECRMTEMKKAIQQRTRVRVIGRLKLAERKKGLER